MSNETTKHTYTVYCYVDHTRTGVLDTCGHKHRTLAAAVTCRDHLLHAGLPSGSWSAKWHHNDIRDNATGTPVMPEERTEPLATPVVYSTMDRYPDKGTVRMFDTSVFVKKTGKKAEGHND